MKEIDLYTLNVSPISMESKELVNGGSAAGLGIEYVLPAVAEVAGTLGDTFEKALASGWAAFKLS